MYRSIAAPVFRSTSQLSARFVNPSAFSLFRPLSVSSISLKMTSSEGESTSKRVKLSPDVESLKVTDALENAASVSVPTASDNNMDTSSTVHTVKVALPAESDAAASAPEEPKTWKPLVWVDCEMTGLNVYEDNIIEICCLITDGNLNLIDDEGYESTVYVPKEKLDGMDEWCLEHHGASGLIDKVLANKEKTIDVVETELLAYLKKHIGAKQGLLAGNTIHMDRFFMNREMPKVLEYLHYRIVDVSSIMEIGFRHNPELMKKFPKKKGAHTARSDILESLEQLRWYRDNYFVQPLQESSQSASESTKVSTFEAPPSTATSATTASETPSATESK